MIDNSKRKFVNLLLNLHFHVYQLKSSLDTGLTPVAPLCSVLRNGELSQGHVRSDDPFFY